MPIIKKSFARGLAVLLTATGVVHGLPVASPDIPGAQIANAAQAETELVTAFDHRYAPWGTEMSYDGRYVAFDSDVDQETGGMESDGRVYLRDMVTGEFTDVSEPALNGRQPSISGDGRHVAFVSDYRFWSTPSDATDVRDIFVRDLNAGGVQKVSTTWNEVEANAASASASVSGDGRYIAFSSAASNMVAGDTNGADDIFLRDMTQASPIRISLGANGVEANGRSWYYPQISADGRSVAFYSEASNLVANDTNSTGDVFVYDVGTQQVSRLSVSSAGIEGNKNSYHPKISGDGRYVAFASRSDNLVEGDTSGEYGVYLHDRNKQSTIKVSVGLDRAGAQGVAYVPRHSLSGDGRHVAFSWGFSEIHTPTYLAVTDLATGARADLASYGHLYEPRRLSMSANGGLIAHNTRCGTYTCYRTERTRVPHPSISVGQVKQCGGNSLALAPVKCGGDPVNTATGAFTTSARDLALGGIGLPFEFRRDYSSQDTAVGPLGPGWTHAHAMSLEPVAGGVRVRAENGQEVMFIMRDDVYVGPPGSLATLETDANGYTLTRRDQIRYRFNLEGQLISKTDRNGNALSYSYANGQLSQMTDTVGRVISFTYNLGGLLEKVQMPDGRSVGFGYTGGRLTSVVDVRGNTTTYMYDDLGRLTDIIDQNQHTLVDNVYAADGRVSQQRDARGHLTDFTWDPATQTATITDARGNAWKDIYDGNVLVAQADPLGNRTDYKYDSRLDVVSITDPRGNKVRFDYDSRHNLVAVEAPAPLSYKQNWTYNSANDVMSYTNGRRLTTSFDYDPKGNLIKVTRPGSVITSLERDSVTGLVTSTTNPNLKTTNYTYDPQGNRISARTPLGRKTTMGYDSSGRVTAVVEPRGNAAGANPADYTWFYTYDNANHLRTLSDPLGNKTEWSYDPAGNVDFVTDAKLRVTDYAYYPNNLLKWVDPPGTVGPTVYDYDPVGNLKLHTDAKLHTTDYLYDAANRLETVIRPTGKRWDYTYDTSGNLKAVEDATGNSSETVGDGTTTYSYDEINRLKTIDYSDATPDVGFTYDANSNRTQMTDGAGTVSYVYDDLDRLTSTSRGADTFVYEYNLLSNVTKRTFADGTVADYNYDDDGLLASVVSGGATTSYAYDAAGNLETTTLPAANGHVETRRYDRAGRLEEVANAKGATILSKFGYTLNELGNPAAASTPNGPVTYLYDSLDRLTDVCYAVSCTGATDYIRYTYDDVGNRLTEIKPSGTTTYNYDVADQLTSSVTGSTTTSHAHDANGNQTQAGAKAYAYDLAGRMTTATIGRTTTNYTYDGDGLRLSASTGSQTAANTKYLWDINYGLPELALERDGGGGLVRLYVEGLDLISMTASGGAAYYFHRDGLGSVSNVTNASGAPQWAYSYEPFGTAKTETKVANKAPANPMRFTSEYLDPTGLYHLRARQYDATTGRFTATDPLSPAMTDPYVSAYVYVGNQPTVYTDPSGEFAFALPLAIVGVGAALTALGIMNQDPEATSRVADSFETHVLEPTGGLIDGWLGGSAAPELGRANDYSLSGSDALSKYGASIYFAEENLDLERLADGEFERVFGESAEDVKEGIVGKGSGKHDLYKDKKTGDIYVVRKGGVGEAQETGFKYPR